MDQQRKRVRAGDVITAVDGEAVDSPGDISRVINRKKEATLRSRSFATSRSKRFA
jgi:S1-C subfamily serine protease